MGGRGTNGMADLLLALRMASPTDPLPPQLDVGYSPVAEQETSSSLHPALQWAPVIAELADAATTYSNLQRGGMHESNPLMKGVADDPALLFGTKLAGGIGTMLVAKKLAEGGHPGWGKAAAILGTALPAGMAVRNLAIRR